MAKIRRYGRWIWIGAGLALGLAVLLFLLRDPAPRVLPGAPGAGKPVPADELVKMLRENTRRADPRPPSAPQPRQDGRQGP